jgi:N-acetyl-gamma-glutamyl-phosphate reductase
VPERNLSQPVAAGAPRVLVVGATGFAGALAAHLLWRHEGFELAGLTGRSEVGHRHDELHPRYRVPLVVEELEPDRHAQVDAALVAYPHGAAAPVVALLRERGVRVIDLSADFRLRASDTYEHFYGEHPEPGRLGEAVYGLPELHREAIRDAGLVAGPGCFPTAALIALAPLARAGLIEDVVIDAKTGVSGAGRAPSAFTHFSFAGENVSPYKVAGHRHTPEIEEQLAALHPQGRALAVQFQPHLVPLDEGELVSCYVALGRELSGSELSHMYADTYAEEPLVELAQGAPATRDVRETSFCRVFATLDEHTGKALVFAAIDNLWKGTSAQAVQSLNLMFGIPETAGLL